MPSLGDVIIAEPKALLGFAGPRVIQQTIGQDLPEGFQSSEFFLDKGFLDTIVDRKDLRDTIDQTRFDVYVEKSRETAHLPAGGAIHPLAASSSA